MKRIKIFFDTEFTSLSTQAKLISLGCISEYGDTFYAEFNVIQISELNQWVKDNVLNNCIFLKLDGNSAKPNIKSITETEKGMLHMKCFGDKKYIKNCFLDWLGKFMEQGVEFWGDCLAYDWVLLSDLWDNALNIPSFIHYIPLDISTLFYTKGIDNNINRIVFSGMEEAVIHNALSDAIMIKKCYEKLAEL